MPFLILLMVSGGGHFSLGSNGYYLQKITGTVGELELFEFNLQSTQAKEVAKALRDAGMQVTATQLRKQAIDLGILIINELAEAAKEIAQDAVPVDSTELALEHIHTREATENDPRATVYIDGSDHYGNRYGPNAPIRRPEEASSLAKYLDDPDRPLSRTQTSFGGLGGPTKDWIKDAQLDFQGRKADILKRII